MIFLTPGVNKKTTFFQLAVIACFAFSLYMYLHTRQEEISTIHDLNRLSTQRTRLKQTLGNVIAYNKLLSTDSTLAHLSSKLNWEQVNFSWTSLSFTELLQRIDDLSHQQKIFVLESFAAEIQDERKTPGPSTATDVNNASFPEFSERIFHMRGYFLCPSP